MFHLCKLETNLGKLKEVTDSQNQIAKYIYVKLIMSKLQISIF